MKCLPNVKQKSPPTMYRKWRDHPILCRKTKAMSPKYGMDGWKTAVWAEKATIYSEGGATTCCTPVWAMNQSLGVYMRAFGYSSTKQLILHRCKLQPHWNQKIESKDHNTNDWISDTLKLPWRGPIHNWHRQTAKQDMGNPGNPKEVADTFN